MFVTEDVASNFPMTPAISVFAKAATLAWQGSLVRGLLLAAASETAPE